MNKLINNNELVFFKGKKPVTNSKIISERTGIKHHSIQQLIENYKDDFEEFGKLKVAFEMRPSKTNQKEKIYLLNEEQSTLLLTYSKNNTIVREFKKSLVKAFFKAKKLIEEKKTPRWKQQRIEAKTSTKALHDDIHNKFIPYAVGKGSKTYASKPKLAYTHFEKPINKALEIVGHSRDDIDTVKQNMLDIMNKSCSCIIGIEIGKGTDYHDVVSISKDKLTQISKIFVS